MTPPTLSSKSVDLAVLDRGIDVYVDIRSTTDFSCGFFKLSMTTESISVLRRLRAICVDNDILWAADRWHFGTANAKTDIVLASDWTVDASTDDFGITTETVHGGGDVSCHRIKFSALARALSAGRHESLGLGFTDLGGALLYSGYELENFAGFVAQAVPELVATQIAMDMAARIGSTVPEAEPQGAERLGAAGVRRRVGV